jgi:predicted Na+-dependent transporter
MVFHQIQLMVVAVIAERYSKRPGAEGDAPPATG